MMRFKILYVTLYLIYVLQPSKAQNRHQNDDTVYCVKNSTNTQPRHIHINYGVDPYEMVITWTTCAMPANLSVVVYKEVNSTKEQIALANTTEFITNEKMPITRFVHRVILRSLLPNRTYTYKCGNLGKNSSWSVSFNFNTMPNTTQWSPKFAVYGDMGVVNAQSMPRLLDDLLWKRYEVVLHVGDFAYDMASDDGKVGDQFMAMIQPIAARIPYMTTVGNHEHAKNFSYYKNVFSMPNGDGQAMFSSFNVGPVHFVSLSTEFYFYLEYGYEQMKTQYQWLEKDLQEANKPENRAQRPWIILLGHRPLYCTNPYDSCTKEAVWLRYGVPVTNYLGLENLLVRYGVDLSVWAHEHSYERLWPIYDNNVHNGSSSEPYTNPGAPVHIITGSAGCKEKHAGFGPYQDISAFRSNDYGYSRMQVLNATHLYWEQVSDDKNGLIIDRMNLIKHYHGPYENLLKKQ